MDLFDATDLVRQDFFQDSHLAGRYLLPQVQIGDSLFYQDSLLFSPQPCVEPEHNENLVELMHGVSTTPSSNELPSADDTNHLEEFLGNKTDLSFEESLFQLQKPCQQDEPLEEQHPCIESINANELEPVIAFLVEHATSNILQTNTAVSAQFPQLRGYSIVRTLVEKFGKLKKTKQELIKYCMRKAFKFVLELPKNEHLLRQQKDRLSFSKGKSRFLRKISEEKSMNSKFLAQVFSQGDFSQDYLLFLEQFEQIMIDDNVKKLKYLACLLTNSKESGKQSSVEMVRRLPWTRPILQKVLKISRELLKFSPVQ